MKLNIILKLLLIVVCVSCSSFPKNNGNYVHLHKKNVTNLNGSYRVVSMNDSLKDKRLHNAFEKFYRSHWRFDNDTTKMDSSTKYSFSLKVLEKKKVCIKYLRDGEMFREFILKYKLKPNGFLYLKNKNFRINGIPYLFGGYDMEKLRIGIDLENNLIIEEDAHFLGGILIIIGAWYGHYYQDHYKRIE